MNFLIINSTDYNYQIYIELNDGNQYTLSQHELDLHFKDNIVYLLDNCLKEHNLDIHVIDCIGVVTGPGSYTSLRVGLSMANVLSLSLQVPVLGVSLFEVLISNFSLANALHENETLLAAISNKKSGFFAQFYDYQLHAISEPIDLDKNNIIDHIKVYNRVKIITNNKHIEDLLLPLQEELFIHNIDINMDAIKYTVLKKYNDHKPLSELQSVEPLYIKPPKITPSK